MNIHGPSKVLHMIYRNVRINNKQQRTTNNTTSNNNTSNKTKHQGQHQHQHPPAPRLCQTRLFSPSLTWQPRGPVSLPPRSTPSRQSELSAEREPRRQPRPRLGAPQRRWRRPRLRGTCPLPQKAALPWPYVVLPAGIRKMEMSERGNRNTAMMAPGARGRRRGRQCG